MGGGEERMPLSLFFRHGRGRSAEFWTSQIARLLIGHETGKSMERCVFGQK